jgi:hypothetical protein
VYNVGEVSTLKVRKVLFTMSWLLYKRFWWRMRVLYVIRDFHPLVLFYALGTFLLALGAAGGVIIVALLSFGHHPTGATAVLDSLLVQTGLLFTLFGVLFDFEHNRPLTPGA